MTRTQSCGSTGSSEVEHHSSLARAFQANSKYISSVTCKPHSDTHTASPHREERSADVELVQSCLAGRGPSRALDELQNEKHEGCTKLGNGDPTHEGDIRISELRWHGHAQFRKFSEAKETSIEAMGDGELRQLLTKLDQKMDTMFLQLRRLVRKGEEGG